MRSLFFSALLSAGALAWIGCYTGGPASPTPPAESPPPPVDAGIDVDPTPGLYPTLEALYGGEQGIYRGCGPNNGVCHNAKEFPNLATMGAVIDNVGAACNEKRDTPKTMDDLCERVGDSLHVGGTAIEIAHIDPDPTQALEFHVTLRSAPPALGASPTLDVTREVDGASAEVYTLSQYGVTAAVDPSDATGKTLLFTIPAPDPSLPPYEDAGTLAAALMKNVGVPADPSSIQVGDPNENGVFGAELGGKLIVPGDTSRSYLFKRLTDPSAGPVMPRANCCYWTKKSLRALWCWVSGLKSDGSNALDAIDYGSCPDGPVENIVYPEPGPACESSGMCPVQPGTTVPDDPTWHNVYTNILVPNCGGGACHVEGPQGGLDMSTEDNAWTGVSARVLPGNPSASKLYVRIDPPLCMTPSCTTMPLGRAPLSNQLVGIVGNWIQAGATRD
jgi:hypothetical protein